MSGSLLPTPQQWFDNNGNPLANGTVTTYIAGTSTLKTSYSNYDLSASNTNPVQLDAAGRASIWGEGGFKIIVKDADGATISTVDDVRLNGTVATIVGGFTVDHTTGAQPYPVNITHSNLFTNLNTYGSGTVKIEATAQNCNQPLLITVKTVDSANFGNSANLILKNNGGSTITTSSRFAVDLEWVTNNSLIDQMNGKFETGAISGYNSVNRDGGGLWYLASRNEANNGFERFINIYQLRKGGEIESLGNGISFDPTYTNTGAAITLDNSFSNSTLNIRSESDDAIANIRADFFGGTGKAQLEVTGSGSSYIRASNVLNHANIYCEARAAGMNSTIEARSNWNAAGTGSAIINLYTDNVSGADGYRIQANGVNGRLNVRHIVNGAIEECIDIDPAQDGLMSVYRNADYSKGRMRLGNGSGAAGGGIFEYDSNTGVLDITGANNYVTMGSSGLIQPTRLTQATPADGGTTVVSSSTSDLVLTAGLIAAHTVTLPSSRPDGFQVTVMSTGGITALTVGAGAGTVLGAPTTLAANSFFTMIYRASVTTWYRKG